MAEVDLAHSDRFLVHNEAVGEVLGEFILNRGRMKRRSDNGDEFVTFLLTTHIVGVACFVLNVD